MNERLTAEHVHHKHQWSRSCSCWLSGIAATCLQTSVLTLVSQAHEVSTARSAQAFKSNADAGSSPTMMLAAQNNIDLLACKPEQLGKMATFHGNISIHLVMFHGNIAYIRGFMATSTYIWCACAGLATSISWLACLTQQMRRRGLTTKLP